jgi:hypothetical protein
VGDFGAHLAGVDGIFVDRGVSLANFGHFSCRSSNQLNNFGNGEEDGGVFRYNDGCVCDVLQRKFGGMSQKKLCKHELGVT